MRTVDQCIITARFDSDALKSEAIERVVEGLGGKIVGVSVRKPKAEKVTPKPANLKEVLRDLQPETLRIYDLDPNVSEEELRARFVTRERLDDISVKIGRPKSSSHRTRAWRIGFSVGMAAYKEEPELIKALGTRSYELIDLDQVEGLIRAIEAGDLESLCGLGATYWDLYVELINEHLKVSNKAQPLLGWNPEIHPYLESTNEETRLSALNKLEKLYEDRAATQKQMRFTL